LLRLKRILLSVIYLIFFSSVAAEPTYFERVHYQQGLNSNYINKLIQRKDGFIWLATAGGLSRFDGYNFVNFSAILNDPTSLPDSWANCLLEDSNGKLWVGTEKGLALLMKNEKTFQQFLPDSQSSSSISGSQISDLYEDSKKRLWIATNKGISLYLPQTGGFSNYSIKDLTVQEQGVNFILQAATDSLWVGTDHGLFQFDINSGSFERRPLSQTNENYKVLDGALDANQNLWLALAENGVAKYVQSVKTVDHYTSQKSQPNTLSNDYIWTITVDKDNTVWAGSWGGGLTRISANGKLIDSYQYDKSNNNSIPNNSITDIMQDQSGSIWIATYDGLALYQPDRAVEIRNSDQGDNYRLSVDFVWALEEDDESIWIGTTEGLNQWSKQSNKIHHFYAGKEDDTAKKAITIWVVKQGIDNQLWLGTEFGLALFNKESKELIYLHETLASNQLTESHKDILKTSVWSLKVNQDNTVWVGTNAHHLYLLDKDQGIVKDYTSLIYDSVGANSNIEFTGIIQGLNNNLWLATTTGLLFLDSKNEIIKKVSSSDASMALANEWIYTVVPHMQNAQNKEQLYWISSQHFGLSLIAFQDDGKIKKLKHFNSDYENFDGSTAYSINQIDPQNLWFTDSTSLYHYDIISDQITNYGSRFFLSETVFHENTQIADSRGFLYFGSSRGLVKFHPKNISPVNNKANLYFTSISSNTMDLSIGSGKPETSYSNANDNRINPLYLPPFNQENIHFSYENVLFKFEFAALDYQQSKNINYSYRLNGLQDHWQNLGTKREVSFSNLPAGNYQLEINAKVGIHQLNQQPLKLNFVVAQKPWLTPWAYLAYTLIAGLLFSSLYKIWRQKLLTQHALNNTQMKLSQALWGSGDELWQWNIKSSTIQRTNQLSSLKARPAKFNGQFNFNQDLVHPDDVNMLQDKFEDIKAGRSHELESIYRQKNKNNRWIWLHEKAKITRWDKDGCPLIVSGTCRDINKLKESDDKNRLIASAFQSTSDGAIVLDRNLRVLSVNDSFCRLTKLNKSILGNRIWSKEFKLELLSNNQTTKEAEKITFKTIRDKVLKNRNYKEEIHFSIRDGKKIPLVLRVSSVLDINEKVSHFVIMITDITFRQEAERKLRKMASLDALTGLPNRAYLLQLLEQGLLRAKRNNTLMAILFIDLDHFKNVNDSLGHFVGDELLVAVSHKLTSCIRESDSVARLGGDEFTIALFELNKLSDILNVAEKVLDELSVPIKLKNHELIISPSIGIATYPEDGVTVEVLLKHADTAMYHAKRNGRNNFQFFAESMNQIVLNRVELESKLRSAIKVEQFELYYQPKYCLKSHNICGFEALIRWNHPQRGLVGPDDFIPIAEETGLIIPIGEWVLMQACQQLKTWQAQGYSDYHLAINLSALQFIDRKLIDKVAKKLSEYGVALNRLEVELTESTLIENIDYTKSTLMGLRQLGVRISLDDFGTGYSSLSYLRQLPIDFLKIDRSFVKNMVEDQQDAKMVESIVSLAHNLGVSVVAEGIETKEQLEMFIGFRAEQIQGYLLSKPITAAEATQLLTQESGINILFKDSPLLAQQN
jgi:diguanylate cyclase (GGDEF)-like protein/PAS domain S-box-containing protein